PVTLENFRHFYISQKGRLFNSKTKNLRKQSVNTTSGYLYTGLTNNEKFKVITIHRLVALAFIENPDNKKTVNHKDGDKNNNHINNLEWMTDAENIANARETGLYVQPENYLHNHNRWVLDHKSTIKNLLLDGYSYQSVADKIGTSREVIKNIQKMFDYKIGTKKWNKSKLNP